MARIKSHRNIDLTFHFLIVDTSSIEVPWVARDNDNQTREFKIRETRFWSSCRRLIFFNALFRKIRIKFVKEIVSWIICSPVASAARVAIPSRCHVLLASKFQKDDSLTPTHTRALANRIKRNRLQSRTQIYTIRNLTLYSRWIFAFVYTSARSFSMRGKNARITSGISGPRKNCRQYFNFNKLVRNICVIISRSMITKYCHIIEGKEIINARSFDNIRLFQLRKKMKKSIPDAFPILIHSLCTEFF